MKFQLITAVAGPWSCRERDLTPLCCLEVFSDRSLTRNRGELLHHSNDGEIKEKADGKYQRHVRQPSIAIFIANKGCAIVHN